MLKLLIILLILISPTHIYSNTITFEPYAQVVSRLRAWQREYPKVVTVEPFGKCVDRQDIYCLALGDKSIRPKHRVLIMAAIHGNEPLAALVVLNTIQTILDHQDEFYVREMLSKREVYFVPIVCPSTYGRAREIYRADPNRNFEYEPSLAPVESIKRFGRQLKFDAVLSGHTFGRVYLYPWGYTREVTPHDKQYKSLLGTMSRLSGYSTKQSCYAYPQCIRGTEGDFFYRLGACSVIMEFGLMRSHDTIPSKQDISEEFRRTYWAIIYFIKQGPVALQGDVK